MKVLQNEAMSNIEGGGLTNRQCMILGGLAIIGISIAQYNGAIGATAVATVGGCFESW
jgi:hypothetical protein